jgi:anti-sigma B factor antagonist
MSGRWRLRDNGLEWHVIIRQLDRARPGTAASDGGSDVAVITAGSLIPAARLPEPGRAADPGQLGLSCLPGKDGCPVVTVSGELDIATAEQAYVYLSEVIDTGSAPVTVDLAGLTFCDASGLGMLARVARRARLAGRPFRLSSARPSLLKIMRITGMDRVFPELQAPAYRK